MSGENQEGVSDIETEKAPSMEELQAQLQALQEQQAQAAASWQKKEEQYLNALAGVDSVVKREAPRGEPAADDDELDPVIEKKLTKLRAADEARYSVMQDQLDQMSFGQMAAAMGVSQEDYIETEKVYAQYRQRGVALVDETGQKRPLTRVDVLDRLIAQRARGDMMKAAPTKNLEALRGKLVGQASFPEAGTYEGAPKLVRLDAELDKAPNSERTKKLEKTLAGIEF